MADIRNDLPTDLPDLGDLQKNEVIDLTDLGFIPLDEPEEVAEGITLYATAEEVDPSKIKITFNENAAITTRANTLRTGGGLGLNLTGTGVTVGVWDGGAVLSTHDELNGRVTVIDPVNLSDHSTHVAGTIGATGLVTAARGMANQVDIRSRDFNNDMTELNADAGLIELSNHSYGFITGWLGQLVTVGTILTTPTDFWTDNRSNFSQEDPDFGRYSNETQTLDDILYNNPALLSVWAAGNDRNDLFTGANGNLYLAYLNGLVPGTNFIAAPGIYLIDPVASGLAAPPQDGNAGAGYDSLPEQKTAKNTLVVGSINDTTWTAANTIVTGGGIVSSFSSWGPTDDGRMKPDLVANGESLYSSIATGNSDYANIDGTSLEAANVTGTMALLYEHHQNLDALNDPEYENVQNITNTSTRPRFKAISDPLSSTMKGLAIHTATDIGLTGPDYQSGWGLLNGQSAATFLSDLQNPYLNNRSLLAEDTFVGSPMNIGKVNSSGGEIKVTLVWTDPAPSTLPVRGTNDGNIDDSTSVLVNDLDLYLQDSSGNIYYPWTLDPSNPGGSAVKTTANNRDNVEQVVFNATTEGIGAGDYTVYVGGSLDAAYTAQDFSIFFSSVPQFGDGHGWGDVHLVTFDGKPYDFQSVGEFILVESTIDDWQIQTRQKPLLNRTDVSVNTAFATKMDGFTVVYDLERPQGDRLTIEGTTVNIPSGGSQTLSASIIERQGKVYTFTWAGLDGQIGTSDDDRITARVESNHINIDVDPADYRTTFVRGLLGDGNGNVADDFTLRNGDFLSVNPTAQQIHTEWARSWNVSQSESLFDEPFEFDEDFPERFTTIDDFPEDVREEALEAARAAGIPEEFVAQAALDFAATGDENFIKGPAEIFNLDFGDAPEDPNGLFNYQTTLVNNGARHFVNPDIFLGLTIDREPDGQPSPAANGDDTGIDDEDGVKFLSPLIPGTTVEVEVTASIKGYLNAWVDFNADGDWNDRGEQIFQDQSVSDGENTLSFFIPPEAVLGATYSRFRFTSYETGGDLQPFGVAEDGEVEDYLVQIEPEKQFDFGDAPEEEPNGLFNYQTTLANDGARHFVNPDIFLGFNIDREHDGQPTIDAMGDDNNDIDDEDGVKFLSPLIPGTVVEVEVTASSDGFLNAWLDFNGNGIWDIASEQIFADEVVSGLPGTNILSFFIPPEAVLGATYSRFRFTSYQTGGNLQPFGVAEDGEVEDYLVRIEEGLDFGDAPEEPDVPYNYPTTLANNGARHKINTALFLGNTVDAEGDGQPTVNATGDGVDEDGVTFSPLVAGSIATANVTVAGGPGLLNAWVDFNADGDWQDPGEQIFKDEPVLGGLNALNFNIPANAKTLTPTYARFRLSNPNQPGLSDGGILEDGNIPDGEVEDYLVRFEEGLDFGDAPDPTYPTLLANNGPRHIITNLRLGEQIDPEADGQPSNGANRDDLNGGPDDEDGVTFSPLVPGAVARARVIVLGGDGILNAWMDFNQDGDWSDPGEQIAVDVPVNPVVNFINFSVPREAKPGISYARFRLSSPNEPGLHYEDDLFTGAIPTGEVEDYRVRIRSLDFGDAPNIYPVRFHKNGARHVITSGVSLGQEIDPELNGQPSNGAIRDDLNGSSLDDEDGVIFTTSLNVGAAASLDVTASVDGYLNAWMDFNRDGIWNASEQIFQDELLTGGVNSLSFNVPGSAIPDLTYARFRFTTYDTSGSLTPRGLARDGEVEDYRVRIRPSLGVSDSSPDLEIFNPENVMASAIIESSLLPGPNDVNI